MFNIENFKSASGLEFGGSRPSLFKVNINYPSFTNVSYSINISKLTSKFSNLCHVSSLPGTKTNSPVKVNYLGRQFNFSSDRSYENFQTTVYNDEDFLIRNHFELWIDKIQSTDFILQRNDEYKVNVTIEQYSKNGKKIKDYEIFNCFPVLISEIPLNFSNNEISSFLIQWAYDYFKTNYYDNNGKVKVI